jgi:hypothetical protein
MAQDATRAHGVHPARALGIFLAALMTLSFLFALAIGAVVVVWIRRRRLRGRGRALSAALPGRSPEQALPFARFDEIDAHVRRARCHCGGHLRLVSEASRSWGETAVRVVHCECTTCEDEHDLFFEQSEVLH